MNLPDDTLPGSALKRFALAFLAVAFVVFVAMMLHADGFEDGLASAGTAAVIGGAVGGVVAAFGKKMLRCVLRLAVEIITNP